MAVPECIVKSHPCRCLTSPGGDPDSKLELSSKKKDPLDPPNKSNKEEVDDDIYVVIQPGSHKDPSKKKKMLFQSGAADPFLMSTQMPLGDLTHINVWQDSVGLGELGRGRQQICHKEFGAIG
jgi:hypothetical protein